MIQDVVIVGAGAAGIGCGVVLRDLGIKRFLILDREHAGASFDRWPAEMRFITPSFTSNAFGMLDLNAVALATSPAYTLKVEHPTGRQYASYLRGVAQHFSLPVKKRAEVQRLERTHGGFRLETTRGPIRTRFVIWATGEFQYPNLNPFPGADLCLHTAKVNRWSEIETEEAIVIGGYESGADAAVHLSASGKRVTLLDTGSPWTARESDPSVALSPYTQERIAAASRVELCDKVRVERVVRSNGHFEVFGPRGRIWKTKHPPFLATGFGSGLQPIRDHFAWKKNGDVVLTEFDESTITPGLYVTGPQLRHQKIIFCFIYKFRQRFAVIGQSLAGRLDLSTKPLEAYRDAGMMLEDLRCCKAECKC